MEKYDSNIFEVEGYKWLHLYIVALRILNTIMSVCFSGRRLTIYPEGYIYGQENSNNHISPYLAIAETHSLPPAWEFYVNFKFFPI